MNIRLQAFCFLMIVFVSMAARAEATWAGAAAVEDRSLTIVVRPAVNLASNPETATSANSTGGSTVGSTGELTLAEIVDPATIGGDDREAVMRHLKSIVLTDRPKLGEERIFTQEGLESIVAEASRRLETAGYTVDWKIPRRSHISRKVIFNRDTISKQLQIEFASRCAGCDVSIRRLDLPDVTGLKIQSWRTTLRSERPRGSFAVPIEFDLGADLRSGTDLEREADPVQKRTLMLTGQVEFFANVLVATRAVNAGEKLGPGDTKVERRNITFTLDAPAEVKDFENSVAARGLAMGEPLWKASLRREQVVRFGDPVRVQVGGDTWSVTSEGLVQGAAALGESVRVKVGKSQKLVSGILKEKGLVEIQ